MLKAEQASEIAREKKVVKFDQIIYRINTKIAKRASRGKYNMYYRLFSYNPFLENKLVDHLERNGYGFCIYLAWYGRCLEVYWKDDLNVSR